MRLPADAGSEQILDTQPRTYRAPLRSEAHRRRGDRPLAQWLALGLLVTAATLLGAAQSRATSLVLVGDSITAGTVSNPVGPAYAELIDGSLAPHGYDVTNVAIGGMSSHYWNPSTPVSYTHLTLPTILLV